VVSELGAGGQRCTGGGGGGGGGGGIAVEAWLGYTWWDWEGSVGDAPV